MLWMKKQFLSIVFNYYAVLNHRPCAAFCCRAFVSGKTVALSPACSRLVEAVCVRLAQRFPTSQPGSLTSNPRQVTRERLISQTYLRLRNRVAYSAAMLDGVELQLFPINEKTVRDWCVLD